MANRMRKARGQNWVTENGGMISVSKGKDPDNREWVVGAYTSPANILGVRVRYGESWGPIAEIALCGHRRVDLPDGPLKSAQFIAPSAVGPNEWDYSIDLVISELENVRAAGHHFFKLERRYKRTRYKRKSVLSSEDSHRGRFEKRERNHE